MKRLLVASIGICTLLFTSCMDLETSNQLEKIAAMNKTLDSIETVFEGSSPDSLSSLSLKAYTVENRIKNNYYSDTINMEFARKVDAFKFMRKSLKPCSKSKAMIPPTIDELRKKLKELQTDIENGDGKREKYNEYVQHEKAKVDQLESVLSEYMETKSTILKTYNELYDELNDFSLSLLK